MGKMTRRWPIVVGIISVLFLATACFRLAGDEEQGQVVSVRATDTNTPPPSDTPVPPSETPTEAEVIDLPLSNNATATETATETATVPNTPIEVAQNDEVTPAAQDPFELTATHIVEEATRRFVLPTTQAAETLGIGIFTETFTPTVTPFGGGITGPAVIVPGSDCIYEVRAGDTLWNISQRFGLLVMDIVSANGISNFNLIVVGDRLTIPGCGTTGYFPPATSTPIPTITPFGFNSDASAAGGGTVGTTTGTGVGTTITTCQSQYTVQEKDTLFSIAIRYGVTLDSIVAANSGVIFNPDRINMGEIICIPSA